MKDRAEFKVAVFDLSNKLGLVNAHILYTVSSLKKLHIMLFSLDFCTL
jgi:hypothetical protein